MSETAWCLKKLKSERFDYGPVFRVLRKVCHVLEKKAKLEGLHRRAYFSGEGDSVQTEFERRSNHLEIGVQARVQSVGRFKLFLLRTLIDDRRDLPSMTLFEGKYWRMGDSAIISAVDLFDHFSHIEVEYGESYDLDDTYTVTLNRGTEVVANKSTVRFYDWKELMEMWA